MQGVVSRCASTAIPSHFYQYAQSSSLVKKKTRSLSVFFCGLRDLRALRSTARWGQTLSAFIAGGPPEVSCPRRNDKKGMHGRSRKLTEGLIGRMNESRPPDQRGRRNRLSQNPCLHCLLRAGRPRRGLGSRTALGEREGKDARARATRTRASVFQCSSHLWVILSGWRSRLMTAVSVASSHRYHPQRPGRCHWGQVVLVTQADD